MTLEGCGNRTRRLYFDIDASQEGGHGAMVFHVKRDYNHTNLKLTPPPQHTGRINTDLATSLSSASPDRMNLRLVRASQYLQQFRLPVYHKAGKLNFSHSKSFAFSIRCGVVSDSLVKLQMKPKPQPAADED
ncbi:hypothetical protein PENNAL_c0006G05432 [Penicillium nalgiovense]|uniref:Uncharacterized protein n=1 Tax=Penicillium nalgiovense TaxID=60175 RepID=A0A1V6Z027_PENNA|nr:hypothetical protein PENNAL_c0006G05432 [Penicillium nalgiovense]